MVNGSMRRTKIDYDAPLTRQEGIRTIAARGGLFIEGVEQVIFRTEGRESVHKPSFGAVFDYHDWVFRFYSDNGTETVQSDTIIPQASTARTWRFLLQDKGEAAASLEIRLAKDAKVYREKPLPADQYAC